ncbi:MAG TPA: hypothetical protein VFG40_13150 [Dyella sp.]|jgi:hypothetical protein|nr:hypothetical protein [Dyella sp.]
MTFFHPRVRGASLFLLASLALLASMPVGAQSTDFRNGTYMVKDGGYTIDVSHQGVAMRVTEPNRVSDYLPAAPGTYQFFSDKTQTRYGMRVVDDHTLMAFKPDRPDVAGTELVLINSAPGEGGAAVSEEAAGRYEALAEQYRQKSESDAANVQVWTACSAVALKRSISNASEADAFSAQMAGMLRQILVDTTTSPCPDVIPQW